jgi:hypothetical protein
LYSSAICPGYGGAAIGAHFGINIRVRGRRKTLEHLRSALAFAARIDPREILVEETFDGILVRFSDGLD